MDINSTTAKASSVASLPLGLGTPQPQAKPQVKAEANPQPTETTEKPITEKDLQSAIQDIESSLSSSGVSIGFNYEKKLGQLYVQITDTVSGDIIREVPSKDFIKHKLAMQEMIGLFLDKEA